jgi:hypothetical protein
VQGFAGTLAPDSDLELRAQRRKAKRQERYLARKAKLPTLKEGKAIDVKKAAARANRQKYNQEKKRARQEGPGSAAAPAVTTHPTHTQNIRGKEEWMRYHRSFL